MARDPGDSRYRAGRRRQRANPLVIYDAGFDLAFLPDPVRPLAVARAVCAMQPYGPSRWRVERAPPGLALAQAHYCGDGSFVGRRRAPRASRCCAGRAPRLAVAARLRSVYVAMCINRPHHHCQQVTAQQSH